MRIPSEVLDHMDEEELRKYSSMIDHSNEQTWEMVHLLKEITQVLENLRDMEKDFALKKQLAANTNLDIRNFENKIMKKYEEFMPVAIGPIGENTCQ